MPTHLHGLQKLGLFVCVLFFFNDTLAHPYISSTYFPFLLFFCVRCHWSQGTSFFFVVVVRSVALSLLSLTSVLHFFASEVFLIFSFFFLLDAIRTQGSRRSISSGSLLVFFFFYSVFFFRLAPNKKTIKSPRRSFAVIVKAKKRKESSIEWPDIAPTQLRTSS